MEKTLVLEATKNGNRISIGVLPSLRALLDTAKRRTLTICSNSLGKPYPSEYALRKAWQDFKVSKLFTDALPDSADLTLHGLRVTYANSVKEAGFDNQAIADAIGHSCESTGRHYSRGADKRHNTLRIFKCSFETELAFVRIHRTMHGRAFSDFPIATVSPRYETAQEQVLHPATD